MEICEQFSLKNVWLTFCGNGVFACIYLGRSTAAYTHRQAYGRNVGRRMVVARLNDGRVAVES